MNEKRNHFVPRFDRFDICEAYYLWLSENHPGQWSLEYMRLSEMRKYFKPAPNLCYYSLTNNGKMIYNLLESRQIEKEVIS